MNSPFRLGLIILLALSGIITARADNYVREKAYPDLTPFVEGSTTIARIRVESARLLTADAGPRQVDCGVELQGRPVDEITATTGGEVITARYTGTQLVSITVGQEYVVFLRHADDPPTPGAEEAARGNDRTPKRFADQARAACAPLHTGLVASTGQLWPVLSRWSDEEGETEYWVVPPQGLEVPSRTPLTLQEVSVHMLEVDGQRVTRPDWDEFDGLPPMPHSFVSYRGAIRWDGLHDRLVQLLAQEASVSQ